MDPELIAYLDERFRESSRQNQELREETSKRFDRMEEQLRHTDVKVEALESRIKQVAEGVAAGNENLAAFKKEVVKEFNDTRSLIKQGYKELDKRVTALEKRARAS